MNVLGIGVPELIIIFLLLLIVAGPKRMAAWAYLAGRELARLRAMWAETMGLIQQELKEAGLEEIQELNKITSAHAINLADEVRKVMETPQSPASKAGAPRRQPSAGTPASPSKAIPAPGAPASAAPHPETHAVGPGDSAGEVAASAAPTPRETRDDAQ